MVRIKHRYLLINILYPTPPDASSKFGKDIPDIVQFRQPSSEALDPQTLSRAIRESVAHLFGDYGAGMISNNLKVPYLSRATSTAIIRVGRAHYRLVWAALTFITRLSKPVNTPCVIQVVRVSGTIRKAEEELVRRARESVLKARRQEEEGQGGVRLLGGIAGAKAQDESRSDDALLNADMEEIDLGVIIPRGVESEDSGEESSERPSD